MNGYTNSAASARIGVFDGVRDEFRRNQCERSCRFGRDRDVIGMAGDGMGWAGRDQKSTKLGEEPRQLDHFSLAVSAKLIVQFRDCVNSRLSVRERPLNVGIG
jgi:hypothetical protein